MSEELQAGDSLGGYVLEQRLGAGGFGAVWKARDAATQRVVALKVLRMDVYSTDNMKLRSEVELLAATASSRSPHVVKVLGGGIEPQPYIVMEFIDGVDLGKELERRKRIPQMETIRIGKAVAEALSALESVGIIHRDVKPTNVMVDVDGVVKLTDFGIAKIVGYDTITATSQMPMTMAYAAPEVWEGKATNRSDLYALGVVLFQCLAGRPPFTGSPAQLFREHTMKDPDFTLLPEGTVPALRDLLRDCLAKLEDDRPPDAASVAEQLSEAERELDARLSDRAGTGLPVHEPQAFGPWLRREPHPTLPWGFLCIHETNGQKATVEIHFSDEIEYGARLRKAVEVNPKLVPLGTERLLGTNRLVLRPGEAFVNAPQGQFQFWVAREELPIRPGPVGVDDATLRNAAASLVALSVAAAAEGLELRLPPESLHLMSDGTILATRAGLATTGDDGMDWLSALPLDAFARTLVTNVQTVQQLAASQTSETGVARPAREQLAQELGPEQTSIGGRLGFKTSTEQHVPQVPPFEPSQLGAVISPPAVGNPPPQEVRPLRPSAAIPARPARPQLPPEPRERTGEQGVPDGHIRIGPIRGNKWWIAIAFGVIAMYVVILATQGILALVKADATDDDSGAPSQPTAEPTSVIGAYRTTQAETAGGISEIMTPTPTVAFTPDSPTPTPEPPIVTPIPPAQAATARKIESVTVASVATQDGRLEVSINYALDAPPSGKWVARIGSLYYCANSLGDKFAGNTGVGGAPVYAGGVWQQVELTNQVDSITFNIDAATFNGGGFKFPYRCSGLAFHVSKFGGGAEGIPGYCIILQVSLAWQTGTLYGTAVGVVRDDWKEQYGLGLC